MHCLMLEAALVITVSKQSSYLLMAQPFGQYLTVGRKYYRIAGTFKGENFCEFRGFVTIRESFLHEIGA